MHSCFLPALAACGTLLSAAEPPRSWVDPDTGHRIVRLTDEPGSSSLYFNQNGYTPDGKEMIFTTPEGISVLDLATHATRRVAEGRLRVIVAGHRTNSVYYVKNRTLFLDLIILIQTVRVILFPKGAR